MARGHAGYIFFPTALTDDLQIIQFIHGSYRSSRWTSSSPAVRCDRFLRDLPAVVIDPQPSQGIRRLRTPDNMMSWNMQEDRYTTLWPASKDLLEQHITESGNRWSRSWSAGHPAVCGGAWFDPLNIEDFALLLRTVHGQQCILFSQALHALILFHLEYGFSHFYPRWSIETFLKVRVDVRPGLQAATTVDVGVGTVTYQLLVIVMVMVMVMVIVTMTFSYYYGGPELIGPNIVLTGDHR